MASERGRNLRGAGQPSYWTLVSLDTFVSGGDGHAKRSDHGVVSSTSSRCSTAASSVEPAQWRKSTMVETVAVGFSSLNQCPECGMTTSLTLLAAARMTTALIGPNDASPPTARPGMGRMPLANNALLSMGS